VIEAPPVVYGNRGKLYMSNNSDDLRVVLQLRPDFNDDLCPIIFVKSVHTQSQKGCILRGFKKNFCRQQ